MHESAKPIRGRRRKWAPDKDILGSSLRYERRLKMSSFTNINVKVPVWLDKICSWPVVEYRRRKYGHAYRRISLGEGKFTIVDQQDFYRFNIFNWCPKENGPNTYAVRLVSAPKNRTKIVSLHREILNPPKRLLVDHHNGNGLDNLRDNLRLATHSQNQYNKGKTRKNSSSRYVGVFLETRSGKWVARITVNRKKIWLGRFISESDAARAYDTAAKKYHGEFARLNFPEPRINTDKQK
jgi:hypothetical protein